MSDEQGGGTEGSAPRLRVAEVFDGRGANGGILISRPQVDPAELAGLTAYLTTAPVALATTKTGEDEMSPGAGLVVPRAYHTDGAWIWPAAVGYYLHRYRLPPQPELIEHIRAREFQVGAVPEELRQAAAAQMLADLAAAKRATGGSGAGGGGSAGGGSANSGSANSGSAGSGSTGSAGAGGAAGSAAGSSGAAGPADASGAAGSSGGAGGAVGAAGVSGTAGSASAGGAVGAAGVSGAARSTGAGGAVGAASSSGVGSSSGIGAGFGMSGAGSAVASDESGVPEPVEVKPAEPSLWLPAPVEAVHAEEPRVEAEPGLERDLEHELDRELEREPESVRAGDRASATVPTPDSASVSDAVSAPDDERPSSAALPDTLPAALPVLAFSTAFIAAGNRHAAWVYEQIETFLDYMPLDEWSVDHDTRRYRQAGREFTVDALGRLAHDGRWIWAWAESESWSEDPALTERSRGLREQGHRLGIKELTAPVLDLSETEDADDPETAAEMLAWTAMGVSGARGYIGHAYTDEGRIYYLSFDESIPNPVPDLDGILHFLSHGVAKFEEDSTDCVLGYVERHGWDWSRSSDGGIVIGAGELGSFTAVLSRDGVLTGIAVPEPEDQESVEPTV